MKFIWMYLYVFTYMYVCNIMKSDTDTIVSVGMRNKNLKVYYSRNCGILWNRNTKRHVTSFNVFNVQISK